MEVKFADTFFESLKKLSRSETWYYKSYSFFRYDIPRFFKNLWNFRKLLWNFYPWEYTYSLMMFRTSLELLEDSLKNGYEVKESRNKKIEKIKRVIEIIKHVEDGSYIEMSEVELGKLKNLDIEFIESTDNPKLFEISDNQTEKEKTHNKRVYKRSEEIEKNEWDELWNTLKGQDYKKFHTNEEWDKQFDGSGLKGWWN